MKLPRLGKAAVILAIAVAVLLLAKLIFLPTFPPFASGPRIVCHKILNGALMQWMHEQHEASYPNVQGDSAKSFALLDPFLRPMGDFADYIYVPGLAPDDPKELVMLFVRRKSRQRWHGDNPSLFQQPRWITIGPSSDVGEGWFELSQSVGTGEMRNRLLRTMDFLKGQNRTNWQAIVREQTEFLKLIHD